MDLSDFEQRLISFAEERDWKKHHLPRSILLALTKEVGELTELLQWTPDSEVETWLDVPGNKEVLSDEIADVFMYLAYLAQATGVDMSEALERKIGLNAQKYPAPPKEAS